MFALVIDGKIVVGPREWKYSMFAKYFEDNGLEYGDFPKNKPEGAVITDSWKLLPVTGNKPSYDNVYEQLAGPFFTINADSIDMAYEVVPATFSMAQSKLKQQVTDDRYKVEVGGVDYTFADGTVVNLYTNREDRGSYLDSMLVMNDTDVTTFKFKGGVFRDVNKADLQSIVGTGVTHIKNAFAWEGSKHAELDGCVTLDDLKLVDIIHPQLVVEENPEII